MAKKPARKAATSAKEIDDYIVALASRPEGGHVVTVMVKAAPDASGLLLAHVGDCRHWAHIPADAISQIKDNGQVRCGAHVHRVADVELKEPTTTMEQAYSALAKLHIAKLESLDGFNGGTDHAPCPPGQHWGQDSSGNWGCQLGP